MIKKNVLTLSITTSLVLLLLLLLPFPSHAQQLSLSLSPASQHLIAKPGQSITLPYTLENKGDPVTIQFKTLQLEVKDNTGALVPTRNRSNNITFRIGSSDQVRVPQLEEAFILNTRETIQIPLRLTLKQNTEETDYIFAFLVESLPPQTREGETVVKVSGSIGSKIFLQVSETAEDEKNIKISLFDFVQTQQIPFTDIDFPFFTNGKQIPFVLRVHNNGKHAASPMGTVTISDSFGKERKYYFDSTPIFSTKERVMKARRYQSTLNTNEELPSQYSFFAEDLPPGMYNATAQISEPLHSFITYSTTSFIIFPLFLTMGIAVVIAVVIVAIIAVYLRTQTTHVVTHKHKKPPHKNKKD